ncbi:MAG TPA: PsbP-related protein [Nitrososphaeraceae archaeon]|nr:PsbP-related protein [Nitrososphaeraceae archaeon]
MAVQNSAMKYFPVSILNGSTNKNVTGNAKKVNFFLYVNPVYGIKIDYPAGWDKLDFDQSNAYGLVAGFAIPREGKPPSEINVSDFILENVMLVVKSITSPSPSSLPTTLNDFVNEQISTYKQRLVDFQIIKSNKTSIDNNPIDNNPAYQIQYTQKDGRATFDTLQIWTISRNKIYTIIFNADPGDYPTYLPVIQKMIDSFDVLDDNSTNNSNSNNQMKLRAI